MFCLSRVTAKTHKLAVRKFKSLKKEKKGNWLFQQGWERVIVHLIFLEFCVSVLNEDIFVDLSVWKVSDLEEGK